MKTTPTVTVLMAAYNVEHYLEEAVKSVLNQSYDDFELLIVEDGSTDNTKKVLEGLCDSRIVKLYNEKNMGLTYSLNRGLDAARGKYIARLDSDDIMLPGRLKQQVNYLEKHPETGLITAQSVVMHDYTRTGMFYNPVVSNAIEVGMLVKCTISHTCVTFRNDLFKKLNLKYSPDYGYMEDYGLWADLINQTKMKATHHRFAVYRKYENSVTDRVYHKEDHKNFLFKTRKTIVSNVMEKMEISLPEDYLENYIKALCFDTDTDSKKLMLSVKSIFKQIPKKRSAGKLPLTCYICEVWYKVTGCKCRGFEYFWLNTGGYIYKYFKKQNTYFTNMPN